MRFKRVSIGVLIAALILFPGLALGYGYWHPTEKVSPISDASWVRMDFQNGISSNFWYTDKGALYPDVPAFIQNGRVYVPFRWAVELFGGSADWASNPDGTTSSVILYAPPVKTNTVTETVTQTVTVPVTNTVYVDVPVYPEPTIKIVGSATVFAGVDIDKDFWGFYKPNSVAHVWLMYPNKIGRLLLLPCDSVGFFQGRLVFNPEASDFQAGDWTLYLLLEDNGVVATTIHVVLPETSP